MGNLQFVSLAWVNMVSDQESTEIWQSWEYGSRHDVHSVSTGPYDLTRG